MEFEISRCVGCGSQIHDRHILRVAPDLEWHASCLKCQECHQLLDENSTCFVRNGKTYCKQDYFHLFGTKCDRCGCLFSKNDFVMRAKSKIYHIECFRCTTCDQQLNPGDEFALRDNGSLYCKLDQFELLDGQKDSTSFFSRLKRTNIKKFSIASDQDTISDYDSESVCFKSREKSALTLNGKTARVRTVLNEKQLSMLRACYQVNSRPDALIKEQLVEMTGLSPRVVRVWFQNKRCKDKKRLIETKLQAQQKKDGKDSCMQGILLHATSPVKHESPMIHHGYEVIKYQPPWKSLSNFAFQNDSDDCSQCQSGFQHLFNQLHGYDLCEINHDPEFDRQNNRDSTDSYQESEEGSV